VVWIHQRGRRARFETSCFALRPSDWVGSSAHSAVEPGSYFLHSSAIA
jgi:hypothetical protein